MTHPHSVTLIFASQRSGSRLLCDDVASLGGLGHPREQFNYILPWQDTRGEEDVFEAIASGATRRNPGVGSVKVMVSQVRPINRYLTGQTGVPEPHAMQNIIEWSKTRFEHVMVLVIVRESQLDQAISRIVARTTQIYHSSKGSHQAKDLLNIMQSVDANFRWKILHEVCLIKSETDMLRTLAQENPDLALLVRYEDLTASVEHTSERLVDHARSLGFSPEHEVATRKLSKMIDRAQITAIKQDFVAFLNDQIGEWVPNEI
ncbi:MAG: Stf0 family sulfotransferase [Pseudomonadota bacterium]